MSSDTSHLSLGRSGLRTPLNSTNTSEPKRTLGSKWERIGLASVDPIEAKKRDGFNRKKSKSIVMTDSMQTSSIDSSKKLSFLVHVEDSGEESDSGGENHGQEKTEELKEPSNSVNQCKISEHKAAVPVESDREDASSTSSCSCENHSSVGIHPEEDIHGDLDYDDGSSVSSVENSHRSADEGQLPKDTTSGSHDTPPILETSDSVIPRNQDSGSNRLVDDKSDGQSEQNLDGGHCSKKETEKSLSTRIKSFINFNTDGDDDRCHTNGESNDIEVTGKKDRSKKSHEQLLKYFFKDTCFFQIKSINHENVDISKRMGIWSTPPQNEVRLNAAFREHRNVILIFSVQQSGAFQGFARMITESCPSTRALPWILPGRLGRTPLTGVMKVQWLCTNDLTFNATLDLYNPFNENKPVKIARDGQQLDPKIGKKLCLLFPHDSKKHLLAAVEILKKQTRDRKQKLHKRGDYYPMSDPRGSYGRNLRGRFEMNMHSHPQITEHMIYSGAIAPGYSHDYEMFPGPSYLHYQRSMHIRDRVHGPNGYGRFDNYQYSAHPSADHMSSMNISPPPQYQSKDHSPLECNPDSAAPSEAAGQPTASSTSHNGPHMRRDEPFQHQYPMGPYPYSRANWPAHSMPYAANRYHPYTRFRR